MPGAALTVRNVQEPLRLFFEESLAGFAMKAGRGGERIDVWTSGGMTSDDPAFHSIIQNFEALLNATAMKAGTAVSLRRANTVLLVIKPDSTGELWVDAAAVSLLVMTKRELKTGTIVFENDIADVIGMHFPMVEIGKGDKVACLFREAWRFGFAIDMNPDGNLDLGRFERTLGTLVRELRYRHIYAAISAPHLFVRILEVGWFPFVEIISGEFREIVQALDAGFELDDIEAKLISAFDLARMTHLMERWLRKPHFAVKEPLLKAAVSAFANREPVAVIKIILTEIEGILNDAFRAQNGGRGGKLKDLLDFAESSAEAKTKALDTLFLPKSFGAYLRKCTFANFDPEADAGTAVSRHSVSHGAAAAETYTMVRALQAILVLDQLAFYT